MNAHQRRIESRRPRLTLDLEAYPFAGFPANMLFCYSGGREGGKSVVVNVLKARPAGPFMLNADYSSLEQRIAAMNPGFTFPYGATDG